MVETINTKIKKIIVINRIIISFIFVIVFLSFLEAQNISITGKVQDISGIGINQAEVRLIGRNITTFTDENGNFTLRETKTSLLPDKKNITFVQITGSEILVTVNQNINNLQIEVYNTLGRIIFKSFFNSLKQGSYSINTFSNTSASDIYFVKIKFNNEENIFKVFHLNNNRLIKNLKRINTSQNVILNKTTQAIDTIAVSKNGYSSKKIGIDSYTGSYTIVLDKASFEIIYPPNGSRVFKSLGGTIMFEWNACPNATSYDVVVDQTTVASDIPNVVTFAPIAVSKLSNIYGAHSCKIIAKTSNGQLSSGEANFTIANAVDGTTGTPMGGIGAGAVKFCPWKGDFAFQAKVPPGKQGYQIQANMKFELFTKRGSTIQTKDKLTANKINNRYDDDAVYPVMYANFGTINDVIVTMIAVSPFNREDMKKTTYPLACYQFTLWNNQTTSVDVAMAFGTNTTQSPTIIDGKGFATSGGIERAIFAKSSDPSAIVTIGNDAGFMTSGIFNNKADISVNKVAVKVTLGPGEKKDIKFVFAWYVSDDKSAFYYTNFVNSAQEVAQYGLDNFDDYRDKAVEHVERFRASNIPDWMLNQTMNEIVWVNNVQYMRDGRYGVTEGVYGWMGQMDQGWHAFASGIWQVPEVIWWWKNASEMEFWARTMMVGGVNDGQISHDFTGSDHGFCQWDDPGYHGWGGPDWVDNNCGFIFGLYEGFIATGDKTRMDFYWPYMKRTANRLYYMLSIQYGNSNYPFTLNGTGCTYDKGTQKCEIYSSGLASVAFKIIEKMAEIYNEIDLRDKFRDAYNKSVNSFQKRWLDNVSFNANQEAIFAGLWMSLYFNLGQMYTDDAIDKAINHGLTNYWRPLELGMQASSNDGENSGWIPYVVSHLGGTLLMTDRIREWRAIERDLHNRIITNRNRVYNSTIYVVYQPRTENYMANDFGGNDFYCSMPVLWRNYMAFIGFMYNAYTGELWLQPKLPSENDNWGESMNHELKDALICIPNNYGTLNYKESGTSFNNKDITVKFDKSIKVNCIYIKDNYTTLPNVTINGITQKIDRVGTGKYDRMIKINWIGNIGTSGIRIVATN